MLPVRPRRGASRRRARPAVAASLFAAGLLGALGLVPAEGPAAGPDRACPPGGEASRGPLVRRFPATRLLVVTVAFRLPPGDGAAPLVTLGRNRLLFAVRRGQVVVRWRGGPWRAAAGPLGRSPSHRLRLRLDARRDRLQVRAGAGRPSVMRLPLAPERRVVLGSRAFPPGPAGTLIVLRGPDGRSIRRPGSGPAEAPCAAHGGSGGGGLDLPAPAAGVPPADPAAAPSQEAGAAAADPVAGGPSTTPPPPPTATPPPPPTATPPPPPTATPPPPPTATPPPPPAGALALTAPPDGAVVREPTGLSVGPQAITRVEFAVDGVVRATDPQPPFEWILDPASLPVGSHRVQVTAVDAGGARLSEGRTYRLTTARFFGLETFWNAPLAPDAPLDPSSSSLVPEIVRQVAEDRAWLNTDRYSSPVYAVGPGMRRVEVAYHRPGVPADPRVLEAFASVPVPPDAQPAAGTDGHMVIWQASTDTMWEFWKMSGSGDTWSAAAGGRVPVSAGDGIMPHPTGATASGLAVAGGMVMLDEVRRGRIDHALALALPEVRSRWFTSPANRTDGFTDSPTAVPEGARLRLDPALDLSTLRLAPLVRMIAEAAQRYGVVVRDHSGSVTFYGEDPTPTGAAGVYSAALAGQDRAQALAAFPWDRLQVLQMDLQCCWHVGNP